MDYHKTSKWASLDSHHEIRSNLLEKTPIKFQIIQERVKKESALRAQEQRRPNKKYTLITLKFSHLFAIFQFNQSNLLMVMQRM
jgi:hypothetical protein